MIIANSRDLRKLVNYIKDLVTYGFDGILTKKEIASLEQGGVMPEIQYKTLIDDSSKETTIFKEKLSGISKLLSKYRETARMQSRVLYKDKNGKKASFSSYIIPNYMGDKIAKIQNFVAAQDTEGFKNIQNRNSLILLILKVVIPFLTDGLKIYMKVI